MTKVNWAVFLDRDGVINENRDDYIKNWSEFVFLPEVFEAFYLLALTDTRIVVLTNQSAVGRGLIPIDQLEIIHQRMRTMIVEHGGRIDAIYYCPHRPEENCSCRKPKTGLAQAAAKEFDLSFPDSYMIGDALSDLGMGQELGCQNILVLTGRGLQHQEVVRKNLQSSYQIADNLYQAVAMILEQKHIIL